MRCTLGLVLQEVYSEGDTVLEKLSIKTPPLGGHTTLLESSSRRDTDQVQCLGACWSSLCTPPVPCSGHISLSLSGVYLPPVRSLGRGTVVRYCVFLSLPHPHHHHPQQKQQRYFTLHRVGSSEKPSQLVSPDHSRFPPS